jgi:hypothetical protein
VSLANQFRVRGNLLPEGFTVPKVTSWPPDAEDGQLVWKMPEDNLYIYKVSEDAWFLLSEKQYHFEPVIDQAAMITGQAFANVRSNGLWRYSFRDRHIGTWSNLYRYCYWQFTTDPDNSAWSDARQFSSENDFYTFIESYVPNNGVNYTSSTRYRCWESVDDEDHFPDRLHFRNSLAASIMGKKRYTTRRNQYGVNHKFNEPNYYINWRNQLGQRFVWAATDVTPVTNNDNVVWFHSGKRGTSLRFPMVGGTIQVSASMRGAAWDTIAGAYVSPAPAGAYTVLEPFFLYDVYRTGMLDIARDFGSPLIDRVRAGHREHELSSPMVAVFPVGFGVGPGGNIPYQYYGFVVVPVNVDNFFTENLGPNDEIALCYRYRSIYNKRYQVAMLSRSEGKFAMWQLPPVMLRESGRTYNDVDKDSIPIRIDFAKRDRSTGLRSAWQPLLDIQRRVHHVAARTYPSRYRER